MKANRPVEALRQHRSILIARWADQLRRRRQSVARSEVRMDPRLLGNLFDEAIALMGSEASARVPRRHAGSAFETLAPFPESVSICIDVIEAGAQVAGAFVADDAGAPDALWPAAARDRCLAEIDTVFHILVHREIQALCDYCLHRHERNLRVTANTPSDLPCMAAGPAPNN